MCVFMPPPLIGGGIKQWCCLTSVCLSRTSGLSREQRSLGRLKLAEVANVARFSDTTFKLKWSKVKVTMPLYSPQRLHIRQLQRSPWEHIHRGNLLLPLPSAGAWQSARQREAFRRQPREEGDGGISWRPPAYSLFKLIFLILEAKMKVLDFLWPREPGITSHCDSVTSKANSVWNENVSLLSLHPTSSTS